MDTEFVETIIVDVCKKTIFIEGDEGNSNTVQCDTTDEFMRVVKVVLDKADPKIVKYADIAIHD